MKQVITALIEIALVVTLCVSVVRGFTVGIGTSAKDLQSASYEESEDSGMLFLLGMVVLFGVSQVAALIGWERRGREARTTGKS